MNKKLIIPTLGFLFFGILMISGCYNDKEELLYGGSNTDCSNPSITKGPLFSQVESIIQSNCVSCHSSSGGQAPDLSSACLIISKWDRIKVRAVDLPSSLQPMPTSGPLSVSDRAKITDWVNAGHKYTD